MFRVYIAGPVTGIPGGNEDAFNDAAERLVKAGNIAVNPRALGGEGERSWIDFMRAGSRC
jgi:hypothetical protein